MHKTQDKTGQIVETTYRFDSASDMFATVTALSNAKLKEGKKKQKARLQASRNASGFMGATHEEIQQRRYGWPEGVREVQKYPEIDGMLKGSQVIKVWSDYDGDDMDMFRYHAGMPCLSRRKKIAGDKQGRVQRLIVNVAEAGRIHYDKMLIKAMCAARIVDELEHKGTRVELIVYMGSYQATFKDHWEAFITAKRPEEPLNLGQVVSLVAPWTLRYWGFQLVISEFPMARATLGGARRYEQTEEDNDTNTIIINRGECLDVDEARARIVSIGSM
jgi:hypothetical protein